MRIHYHLYLRQSAVGIVKVYIIYIYYMNTAFKTWYCWLSCLPNKLKVTSSSTSDRTLILIYFIFKNFLCFVIYFIFMFPKVLYFITFCLLDFFMFQPSNLLLFKTFLCKREEIVGIFLFSIFLPLFIYCYVF